MYMFDHAMQLVLDTSAILAVIAGEHTRSRLIAATRAAAFVAPPSVHWEIANAMVMQFRRGKSSAESIRDMLAAYRRIPIRFAEVDLDSATELAVANGLLAYDAFVLDCARRYRLPLLTLDKGMARRASQVGIPLLEW